MTDYKASLIKALKIIGIVMLVLCIALIITTAVQAIGNKSDTKLEQYIGKEYITKDLTKSIYFVSSDQVEITIDKLTTKHTVAKAEGDIVILNTSEKDKQIVIKLIDSLTIYSEKGLCYMYLVTNEEGTNES